MSPQCRHLAPARVQSHANLIARLHARTPKRRRATVPVRAAGNEALPPRPRADEHLVRAGAAEVRRLFFLRRDKLGNEHGLNAPDGVEQVEKPTEVVKRSEGVLRVGVLVFAAAVDAVGEPAQGVLHGVHDSPDGPDEVELDNGPPEIALLAECARCIYPLEF